MDRVLLVTITCISAMVSNIHGALVVSPFEERGWGNSASTTSTVPEIYQMIITSDIRNRFAHTTVTSRVKNSLNRAQEAAFLVVLPEAAYVSGFIMEVEGKNYTAYVKEKEEAKLAYEQALARGLGAAHVEVSARDSTRFVISVNIQPRSKAAFYLTYEELLDRKDGYYEQIINIHPGQLVNDLSVKVTIAESRKITAVKTPPLRSGNEIGMYRPELDPRADIKIINDTTAVVTFTPVIERQKEFAIAFKARNSDGMSGQFIVQYDVERDPSGGEVLIQDGYFVHFFAPTNLEPLPKHVVFVLDTSGSMWGQKIQQLIQAMNNIVDQLHHSDTFSLVEFNTKTKVWDLNRPQSSRWYPRSNFRQYQDIFTSNDVFPNAFPANANFIRKAKGAISQLTAHGSTSMYGSLQVALRLVELERNRQRNANDIQRQPIVIFLTDGQPTDASTEQITSKISEFNVGTRRTSIFALSFGDGADKGFLQRFASRNSGFAKHIYDAGDAALQLEGFYRLVSSPLLVNVNFKYESTHVTKSQFPIHFGGSEIVVAGYYGTNFHPPTIEGTGANGLISLKPDVTTTTSSNMERIWAYLTIKQLLQKADISYGDKAQLKKNALDIALKYSFVTPVSSLVVVKPNDAKEIDIVEAKGPHVPTVGPRSSNFGQTVSRVSGHSVSSQPKRATISQLLRSFNWLRNILRDGLVNVPAGSYKLGLNETTTEDVPCPKAPNTQAGRCTLLHECLQAVLRTETEYYDHFCVLRNEFAGVCCPI